MLLSPARPPRNEMNQLLKRVPDMASTPNDRENEAVTNQPNSGPESVTHSPYDGRMKRIARDGLEAIALLEEFKSRFVASGADHEMMWVALESLRRIVKEHSKTKVDIDTAAKVNGGHDALNN